MSQEVVVIAPEVVGDYGMTVCSNCGFEIPKDIVICWKCGSNDGIPPSFSDKSLK